MSRRVLVLTLGMLPAACGPDEAQFRIELEPSYVRDTMAQWYGTEDTFLLRGRLEAGSELSPGSSIYARVRWETPPSEYARGYLVFDREPIAVQNAYVELLPGAGALRLGVVDWPLGTDDELFLDKGIFEPLLRERLPRFDVGALYSAEGGRWKADLAVVNGEGGVYADANSDKTVAARASLLAGPLEVGLTGAAGSRHSTPVKEEDDCYGAFLCLRKGKLTARAELMWADWDFRADHTATSTVDELQELYRFGPAAYARLEQYVLDRYGVGAKHSMGWYVRLDWRASERLLLFLHGGQWEPDMEVDWSELARARSRVGLGGRLRLRSDENYRSWFEALFAWTDDPCVDAADLHVPFSYLLALAIERRY